MTYLGGIYRGRYRPPNAPSDGERPLYLHISAASHVSISILSSQEAGEHSHWVDIQIIPGFCSMLFTSVPKTIRNPVLCKT